jgi:hypothetical protein
MDEQFTPVCVHQGLERPLIARLSGEHQGGLGWCLHGSPSSSRLTAIWSGLLTEQLRIRIS